MGVIWTKVWFDLWHNKIRTLLAVLSIAAGVFAIGTIFGLSDQLMAGMDTDHQSVTPAHFAIFLDGLIDREALTSIRKMPGVLDVEAINIATINYKVRPQDEWRQGQLILRDNYNTQHIEMTQLRQGTWPKGKTIGIERLASKYLGIGIGESVIFKDGKHEKTYSIDGLVRHPFAPSPDYGGPAYFFLDAAVMETICGIPSGKFNSIYVRITSYSADNAKTIAANIKEHLGKQNVGVAQTVQQDPQKHWGRMYVDGIPVASDFQREKMVAGRWLEPGDTRAIVINRETAKKNNIDVGSTITLDFGGYGKSDWQVVGLYQVVFNGGGFANDVIFAPVDAVYEATKQYNHTTRLVLRTNAHDAEFVNKVTTQLRTAFETHNVKLAYTWSENELRKLGDSQAGLSLGMLLLLAIVIAIVGGIGLTGELSISVVERTKEIGVLRAIGARSHTIMRMFLMEGVLQGILSWVFSLILALILSQPMANVLGQAVFNTPLDYQYNWGATGVWLIAVIVIAGVASILPARNATRISVRASLVYA